MQKIIQLLRAATRNLASGNTGVAQGKLCEALDAAIDCPSALDSENWLVLGKALVQIETGNAATAETYLQILLNKLETVYRLAVANN